MGTERSLVKIDNAARHVVRRHAVIGPHDADDGNVDVGKNIGRGLDPRHDAEEQDCHRHHDECVGTLQRNPNNSQHAVTDTPQRRRTRFPPNYPRDPSFIVSRIRMYWSVRRPIVKNSLAPNWRSGTPGAEHISSHRHRRAAGADTPSRPCRRSNLSPPQSNLAAKYTLTLVGRTMSISRTSSSRERALVRDLVLGQRSASFCRGGSHAASPAGSGTARSLGAMPKVEACCGR